MKIRSTTTVLVLMAVLWMATPSTASAQVGVLLGLNSTNLKVDPDPDDFDPKRLTGFVGGLSFNVPMRDMVSVEFDALVAQKGSKITFDGGDAKIKITYLDAPVLLRLNMPGGAARAHLLVGPSFNFKLKEDFDEELSEGDDEDQIEKFETALVIGGGFIVNRFRVDLRYGLGLSNIAKDSDGDEKVKNRVFSILVGFGA